MLRKKFQKISLTAVAITSALAVSSVSHAALSSYSDDFQGYGAAAFFTPWGGFSDNAGFPGGYGFTPSTSGPQITALANDGAGNDYMNMYANYDNELSMIGNLRRGLKKPLVSSYNRPSMVQKLLLELPGRLISTFGKPIPLSGQAVLHRLAPSSVYSTHPLIYWMTILSILRDPRALAEWPAFDDPEFCLVKWWHYPVWI